MNNDEDTQIRDLRDHVQALEKRVLILEVSSAERHTNIMVSINRIEKILIACAGFIMAGVGGMLFNLIKG